MTALAQSRRPPKTRQSPNLIHSESATLDKSRRRRWRKWKQRQFPKNVFKCLLGLRSRLIDVISQLSTLHTPSVPSSMERNARKLEANSAPTDIHKAPRQHQVN